MWTTSSATHHAAHTACLATGSDRQLAALQRMAAFSAAVRGHALATWQIGDHSALARCVLCDAELCVYSPVLQPEMDGSALEHFCGQPVDVENAA
jgi:hypothetical protein